MSIPRPRLLVTRRWPDAAIAAARERFELVLNDTDAPLSRDALAEAFFEFDAICPTITDRIDAQMLRQPGLRTCIIANFGAGTEHIDLDAAREAEIVITNTPDILTEATAELAILLMLMVARRAGEGERQLREGTWPGWHPTHMMGRELTGLRLGLVGFGRIGQQTARMAKALWGVEIAYHSRKPAILPPDLADARFEPSLEALLAEADIVSLHCPGGPETRHLIDASALSTMKDAAILINTARGTVVDETALAAALSEGRIAGAGLDVYEREPSVEPALLAAPNVVLLPHLGSATVETRTRMGLRALENLIAYFEGGSPRDRVA
jgi:lactate dehydrogenase-like 2-hydroxyacid dehydrogenase